MCSELNLIIRSINGQLISTLTIDEAVQNINTTKERHGVYILLNKSNNMRLIGQGIIVGGDSRILNHFRPKPYKKRKNQKWYKDLQIYGKNQYCVEGIVPEVNENKRCVIENAIQQYFYSLQLCYNTPRQKYPTQAELLTHETKKGVILNRLSKYTKRQRVDGFSRCWESNFAKRNDYCALMFNGKRFSHHILMYIYYIGDICGITTTVHHKCNNKLCVNPNHLEATTNIGNIHKHHNCDKRKRDIQQFLNSGLTNIEIANKLGICSRTVSKYKHK